MSSVVILVDDGKKKLKPLKNQCKASQRSCPWEWCKSDVVVLSPASLAG
jgi:hypothetical protein